MSEQSLEERIRKPAGHVDAGDAGYSKIAGWYGVRGRVSAVRNSEGDA